MSPVADFRSGSNASAWKQFLAEIARFVHGQGWAEASEETVFAELTPREREVLELIARGSRQRSDRKPTVGKPKNGAQSHQWHLRQAEYPEPGPGHCARARGWHGYANRLSASSRSLGLAFEHIQTH